MSESEYEPVTLVGQPPTLSHLTRLTTEARSRATDEWIRSRLGRRRRYHPPKGGKLRKELAKTRKEVAGRFYQLLSGHAATAEHLRRVGQAATDRCWWRGSGERQTRYHLFVKCMRWSPEIRRLWQRVGVDCGRTRAPAVRHLFNDARATPAVLEFLEDTRVGRMPGQILIAGGPDLEEEDLEVISPWDPEGGGEGSDISSNEEDGPSPPL